jgi:hypothetical protein
VLDGIAGAALTRNGEREERERHSPERRNLLYSLILFSLIACHVWPVRTSSTTILLRQLIHPVSLQPPKLPSLSAEYSQK